ncbi:hypothetical protein IKP85_00570 [bacterium]|nr:hypothetical protein [bacterium]
MGYLIQGKQFMGNDSNIVPSIMISDSVNRIAALKNPLEAKIDHKVEYYKLNHLLQDVLQGKYNKFTMQSDAEYIKGLQVEYENKYGKPEAEEEYYKTPEGIQEKREEEYLKRREEQKAFLDRYVKMYDTALEEGSHTAWNLMYSTNKEEKEEAIRLIKKQTPETMTGFMQKILEHSGKSSSILTQIKEENEWRVNEKWTDKEIDEVYDKLLSNIIGWAKLMNLDNDKDAKELEKIYKNFKNTKSLDVKKADTAIVSLMKRDFAGMEYNGIKYIYVPKMTAPGLAPSGSQKIKMIGNNTFTYGLY